MAHRNSKDRHNRRSQVTSVESLECRRLMANIVVNSVADPAGFNPAITVGQLGSTVTLRDAWNAAQNTFGPSHHITFDPSLGGQTVFLNHLAGDLSALPQNVRAGPHDITIQGLTTGGGITIARAPTAPEMRLFFVGGSGFLDTLTLNDLTVKGGLVSGGNWGGAMLIINGTLNLNRCLVTDNEATFGGGIFNSAGFMNLTNSTIAGNTATQQGGGFYMRVGTHANLTNVTITQNYALQGGGFMAEATPYPVLVNTIVANNDADINFPEIRGRVAPTSRNNLCSDPGLIGGSENGAGNMVNGVNGNILGVDPQLESLASNGGPTSTFALRSDSRALDAGATDTGVTIDQRGVARPQFAGADIGAFEARLSDLNLQSVTTPDGALWFLYGSVNNELRIFRQAIGQSPAEVGGSASFIGLQDDGSVVVRHADGNVYTRLNSANSTGTDWSLRGSVVAGDSATWFLGTDGSGPNRHIYRWASGAAAQYSGGWGVRLAAVGGAIVTQNSGADVFLRVGSASGLGTAWGNTTKTVAGDSATWFILAPAGQGGSIVRWANNAAPQSTGGSGITLSTTPAGDIRTVNAVQNVYQRMGSAGGLGSEWRQLVESLVVTTTADENDFTSSANFGAGTSLREALRFAEQSAGADTITFASPLAGQTITLNDGWSGASDSSALLIASGSNVTINGSGQTLSIAAGPQRRHVRVDGSLIVSNLSFANGRAPDNGGAIWNFGSLTVANSTFTNNIADGQGGAIQSWGGSTLLKVDNATFAANTAAAGSAIATGAVSNTLDHVTIVDNVANVGGGSMLVYQTSVTMRNSIVARNTNDGTVFNGDASGTYSVASANNLVGSGAWTGLNPATNQLAMDGAALKMGTLANNGGQTKTIELLPGSPAINAGVALAGISTDQRGIARPQGSKPDIGAYERQATTAVLSDISYENEMRQAITFSFDGDAAVTFDRSAYGIQNLTTGQPVSAGIGSLDFNTAGTQAVLTLTNLLPDGNYRLSSGSSQRDFTVFAGDANADRRVDISDFAILASRFNLPGTFSQGNFNYDALTDIRDFAILASKFNASLSASRLVTSNSVAIPAHRTPVSPFCQSASACASLEELDFRTRL